MQTSETTTNGPPAAAAVSPADAAGETVITIKEIREFLASPDGTRARQAAGTAIVLLSPWLAKAILGRRSRLLRGITVLGGAIAISRFGDWLRKWDPQA